MAYNFKSVAQESTLLCKLMQNREKLNTDEVAGKELTITAFDFAPKFDQTGNPVADPSTGEQDVFGVVTFAEMPDKYYNVGTVFTKVCKAWAGGFGGDAEAASTALSKSGGVKVRFTRTTTKRGNNLVRFPLISSPRSLFGTHVPSTERHRSLKSAGSARIWPRSNNGTST